MKELKELGLILKEWNKTQDISVMSDESVCKFLVLQKIVSDTLETLVPVFKKEFLTREIDNFESMGMKVATEKESDSHEVNVDSLFSMLPLSDFLKIVNVVKSKATTPEQKAAILVNTTTIQKTGKVVKVSKQTKKEKVLV